MRFDGRISEQSAERSGRRPLTLMNSAPRRSAGTARCARKENVGTRPAARREEDSAWRTATEISILRGAERPQDLGVPLAVRRLSLTMKRLLWLSGFNVVIDFRCLIQRIEQLNMRLLFTRNRFHSQEFSCISRARRSISSTFLQQSLNERRTQFMQTHESSAVAARAITPS